VQYRVKTLQVGRRDVPDVFAKRGKLTWMRAKGALLKQTGVHTDDVVAAIG
jgi:hypothetical protein